MGTSGSYKGSGSKTGKDLRKDLTDWLSSDEIDEVGSDNTPRLHDVEHPLRPIVVGTIRLLLEESNRTKHGAIEGRFLPRMATKVGKVAHLGLAFVHGNVSKLQKVGLELNYLKTLASSLEVASEIVAVAVGSDYSGVFAKSEERLVASQLIRWMLEVDDKMSLTLDQVLKEAVFLVILQTFLAESSDILENPNDPLEIRQERIEEIKQEIRSFIDSSGSHDEFASNANLEIAIEEAIRALVND